MKRKIWRRRMESRMLHYGISLVLLVLGALVFVLLNVVELPEKQAVTLLRTDAAFRVYVPKGFTTGQTGRLRIDLDTGEQLFFTVQGRKVETRHEVWTLRPENLSRVAACMGNDTLVQGYVFTERIKLIHLVFRRS